MRIFEKINKNWPAERRAGEIAGGKSAAPRVSTVAAGVHSGGGGRDLLPNICNVPNIPHV